MRLFSSRNSLVSEPCQNCQCFHCHSTIAKMTQPSVTLRNDLKKNLSQTMRKWHTNLKTTWQLSPSEKDSLHLSPSFLCLWVYVFVSLIYAHNINANMHMCIYAISIWQETTKCGGYGLGQRRPSENSPFQNRLVVMWKAGAIFWAKKEIEWLVQLSGYFSHKLNKWVIFILI